MTTPSSARGWTAQPRLLAAWALVGYAGLHLAFAFFDWLLPGDGNLADRSAGAGFTNLVVLAMPVVAVLLATQIQPTLPRAKADRRGSARGVRRDPPVRTLRTAHRRGCGH